MTDIAVPIRKEDAVARSGNSTDQQLLSISDLTVAFHTQRGEVSAVRGVDLTIAPGEIVALVGESGSGKSTIGNAMMGLLHYDLKVRVTGRIVFRDRQKRERDLLRLSEREMRAIRGNEIAMIFQEPLSSLNPIYMIGAQIVEAIRTHRRISQRQANALALELLELLGLPHPRKCLTSYPHQLSGGMRQRVMIAMALACDPALLIADEPTTALDVTIQAQIIDLLKSLQDRTGMAILFVTHDLGLVAEIADRVMVMYAGQIVEAASAERLFDKPGMPYTKALLDAVPMLGCSASPGYRLQPIPGQAPNSFDLPSGCAFHSRCRFAETPRCTAAVPVLEDMAHGHKVRCARWRELDLGAGV